MVPPNRCLTPDGKMGRVSNLYSDGQPLPAQFLKELTLVYPLTKIVYMFWLVQFEFNAVCWVDQLRLYLEYKRDWSCFVNTSLYCKL